MKSNRDALLVSCLVLAGTEVVALGRTNWLWGWPVSSQATKATSSHPNIRDTPLSRETTLGNEDCDDSNPSNGAVNAGDSGCRRVDTGDCKEMSDKRQSPKFGVPKEVDREVLHGVTITDIDAAARRQFKLPVNIRGALVVEIKSDSAAFAAGLREGDVIQEINRQPTRSAADAMKANKNLCMPQVFARVWSQGRSRYMVVDKTENK